MVTLLVAVWGARSAVGSSRLYAVMRAVLTYEALPAARGETVAVYSRDVSVGSCIGPMVHVMG